MTEESLRLEFGVTPPERKLSVDERRTIRNRAFIARGVHPATRVALAGNGETCGTCALSVAKRRGKVYFKCSLRVTCGAATDIRKFWPACEKWKAA